MLDLSRILLPLALAASTAPATRPVVSPGSLELSPTANSRERAASLILGAAATPYTDAARQRMLIAARDAAAANGDAAGAVAAARALASASGLDEPSLTSDALTAAAAHATAPADFAALARLGMETVARRLAAARTPADYAAAAPLATATATWAMASHDAALQVKAQGWSQDVRALCAEAARIVPAMEKLQAAPEDRDANLAVGKLLCFQQGDWSRGLPHLAKGSDATLASLADLELSRSADPSNWSQLGDGWWEQSRSLTGATGLNVQLHACRWYAKSYPRAIGPRRALIERRAGEAGLSVGDLETLRAQP